MKKNKQVEQNLQENVSDQQDNNKRTLKRNKKRTKRMVEEKLAHALKKLEQFEKRHKTCHESTKWLYQSIIYHHKKDIEKLQKELDKFEKV